MRERSKHQLMVAGLYLLGHLALDWLSFMHPYGAFGITPWNPSTGLSLVLVLRYGRKALPIVLVALLAANWLVRGMPVPLWVATVEALIRIAVYGAAASLLLARMGSIEASLASIRGLFLFLLVASVSSALIGGTYVALLIWSDLMPPAEFAAALFRCWVGDMIGISVITPFGLLAWERRPLVPFGVETALQMASSMALAVWVAVVFAELDQLQLFYFLFLPLTWIAVRSGIEGVTLALILIQAGLLIVVHFFPGRSIDVMDFQARVLVLAVTGLVAGVLVSERRRTEAQLRTNQHALARLSRLGSMGELAITIAHEINQPLSAARTYTRIVAETLQSEGSQDGTTVAIATKAAEQINRAADVVRRLRALARMTQSDLAPISVTRMLHEVRELARADVADHDIVLKTRVAADVSAVLADRLQVEQALLNLIRNSVDAISSYRKAGEGEITIAATLQGSCVELSVHDNGPGFAPQFGGDLPPPLTTTKSDGLGIGLALCRSIAEAHGGGLSVQNTARGATVTVRIPAACGDHHV